MIYLHVPFCGSFCTYCDFYSEICRSAQAFNEYADAVIAEIRGRHEELSMNMSARDAVNTLYIGGGTPSVLPLDVLARIVKALSSSCALRQAQRPTVGVSEKISVSDAAVAEPGPLAAEPVPLAAEPVPLAAEPVPLAAEPVPLAAEPVPLAAGPVPLVAEPLSSVFDQVHSVAEPVVRHGSPTFEATSPFEEFTVEVNPEDIVEKGPEYVRGLIALGVNRVSMGVQSFDDGILRWMNRRHDARRAVEAFRILRGCGVRNISIDLIFGLSQLTDETWIGTIEKALSFAPEHISAYQLSIEEGSALARMVADGRYVEASDEQCRRQYDVLRRCLRQSGYHHYEISNFAKPGFEAVHNSAYWRRVPYIGLGPGAHSLTGNVRSWNSQELPHMTSDGSLMTYSRNSETLSPEDIRVERIMLSLRTDKGLEATELYSLADRSVIDALLSEGALELRDTRIRIPEDHLFTSDEIIRELI